MPVKLTVAREMEEAFSWLDEYWNKPIRPTYYNVNSTDEILSFLDEYKGKAKIIAGGIDLIGMMKNNIISPRMLVDIKNIPHLVDRQRILLHSFFS